MNFVNDNETKFIYEMERIEHGNITLNFFKSVFEKSTIIMDYIIRSLSNLEIPTFDKNIYNISHCYSQTVVEIFDVSFTSLAKKLKEKLDFTTINLVESLNNYSENYYKNSKEIISRGKSLISDVQNIHKEPIKLKELYFYSAAKVANLEKELVIVIRRIEEGNNSYVGKLNEITGI